MVTTQNRLGNIEISEKYFEQLIEMAVSSCIGVTGFVSQEKTPSAMARIMRTKTDTSDSGISVRENDGKIDIDLHISVGFGLNIKATAQNIIEKVEYSVKEHTGFDVGTVNVYVDSLTDE